MEEELKQYALQLKLQNPEITQEELTNKIIEFKNTLNVKTEPQEPGFYEKFFAGVDLLKKMPQNQDLLGLKKGVIDVSAKTAAVTIGLGQGMVEDPVGTLEGLGREAPQALPKFANTVAEMVFDNYKDLEEWGSITALSAIQSLRKGKSLSAEEKLGIQRMAQSSIAMKDRILSKIPFLPSIISTSREDIDSFKEKMNSYTAQHENTITEEFLKGKDANFGEIAGRMIADGIGSLPYTLASINPYTAAAMGAGLAADKFITEFEENPERGLFNLSANAIGTGAIELADAYLTRRFLQTANVLKGGKGTATKAVEEFQKGASDKFLDILGVSVKEGGTEVGQALATRLLDAIPSYFQIGLDKKAFGKEGSIIKDIYSIIDEGIIGALTGGGVTTFGKIAQSKSILKQRAESLLTPNVTVKKLQDLKKSFVEKNTQIQTAQEAGEIEKVNALKKIQSKIKSEILAINAQNRLGLEALEGENLIKYANNVDTINALSKGENNTQNDINKLISENQNLYNTAIQNKYGDNINFAKAAAGQLGFSEPVIAKTTAEFEKKFKDLTGKVIKDSDGVNGVFIGQGKVIINEEVALKQGAVGVGSHEILHPILNAMVGSAAAQGQIVNEFKNSMTSAQKKWVEGEMLRQGKVEGTQEYNTEYLTVFSEGIARKQINFDQSVFEKIKDFLTGRYKKQGFKNIDFVSGQGVYNFMREYAKSIEKGKLTEEVLGVLDKKIIQDIGVIGEQKSSEISNKVQELYESGDPVSIFEILNEYRTMASKQAQRFRDVPGYATNYDLLVEEILTGRRGVYDLIKEYNPNKGVPLAAYINKFLKSRVIEAANRILDTKFKSDIQDIKESKIITETAKEIEEPQQRLSLRKSLNLTDDIINKVNNAVIKSFGIKLPEVTSKQFKNKLANNYKTFLKPVIAKMIGTKDNYKNFLNKNFELIYDIIPQPIINKRFQPFAEPVLDENGKQLRERTPQGNAIFTKKKISKQEFIDYFLGDNVGSSTKGARKTTLSETLAQEIAFDATLDVLRNPEIFEKIKQIGQTQEIDIADNYLSQVALKINRSVDFQFSKEETNAADLYAIRDAIMEGNLHETFPNIYGEILSAAKGLGLSIPDAFKGVTYESYVTKVQNNKKSKNLKAIGDGLMGPTGTDIIFELTKNDGKKIFIATEIKNWVKDQFGSATFRTNEEGSLETTNPLMEDMLPFLAEKLTIYEELHKRAEEIQGEKIPFGFPQKGYLKSTWDKLKYEFIAKERNIQVIFNNAQLIEKFYNKKGVYAMYIGNKGLFYLGNNKYHLKAPRLESKMKTYMSLRSSGTNKTTGKVTLTLRGFNALVNGKNLPKNTLVTDANFETDYFQFSKEWQDLDFEFNEILEKRTGIKSFKRFSEAKGKVRARQKNIMNFFIPYSAEDFQGLMYALLPKGKQGDLAMQWMKENLFIPYSQAMENISKDRVAIMNEFNNIKSDIANISALLNKKIGDYTNQEAIRVWIWNKQKRKIPGLTQTDENLLINTVNENKNLLNFANKLIKITEKDNYIKPSSGWLAGNIETDLLENLNTIKRAKYLEQWKENVNIIFSEQNKNKLRSAYGNSYIESLENILKRMESGRNRTGAGDSQIDNWLDWLNNSVGAIMFINIRSAVLQTISTINYMNWSDNNPLKAAKAFANQKQFWKDFAFIFNSNYLKERRGGLKLNVAENEIANAAKKDGVKGAISYLLNKGFVLTRIADSFAIANGGAALYRNRINTYVKQGLNQKEAEQKAFIDFKEITEESQQSSRPDRISKEQAGGFGRVILAFANTPTQYARLMKRASQDLINKRGDWKTNISKLVYYGAVQNFIFNALQQALFVLGFDSDEEKEKEKKKYMSVLQSMLDSILRGTGVAGNAVMVGKNITLDIIKRKEKPRSNLQDSAWKLLDISPPLDSKITKIRSALYTLEYQGDEIKEKGITLDNPAAMAIGQTVSALTNVPLDRVMRIYDNTKSAVAADTEAWQRVALLLGWSTWELGIKKEKPKKKKNKMKVLKF